MGFDAGSIKRSRGRPDHGWRLSSAELERDRSSLRAVGSLREQAALSLLRRGELPTAVVDEARNALRRQAQTVAQVSAQRLYDDARRDGDPAAVSAARRDRDTIATAVPSERDEMTLARCLAADLPSRQIGGRGDRAMAAHRVEAETRRLERLDGWLRSYHAEQAVWISRLLSGYRAAQAASISCLLRCGGTDRPRS